MLPPFNGIGLLQNRFLFCPNGARPGQRHSVHCDQPLQPPFTARNNKNEKIRRKTFNQIIAVSPFIDTNI